MEPSPAAGERDEPVVAAADRGGGSGTGGAVEPKLAAAAADRISSLPAALQDEILVRLDLRDAVRTSALSRAWRHLWRSLSVISLSFPLGTHPLVVDSVLLRYTGPRVSRFAVYVDEESAGRIDDWLVALSRRGAESIDIRCRVATGNVDLHSSIFSCVHLVSLRLDFCNIPSHPLGFAGFPALQELSLGYVDLPGSGNNESQLEAIIRRSHLLRTLKLLHVFIPEDPDSVIEAPNLRSLTIFSVNDYGWQIGELPCLKNANIHVSLYPHHGHDFADFLAGFAHVRNLKLLSPANDVEIPYTLPFTFYNLRKLKLSTNFTQMHPILFMFTLLRSCHNLEKLKLEIDVDDDQSIEANWEFLNAQWTDGMCANLQVVQMMHINYLPNEISFMKLILSKARLLHTLYVDKHPHHFDDPLIDLLKCRRASPKARVLFEGLVQQY